MKQISHVIDAFERVDAPPPSTLGAFLRWALKGSERQLALGGFLSIVAGGFEVATALMLGWVIDAALASEQGGFFGANVGLLLGVLVFFIILRPLVLGASGVMQNVIIGPSVYGMTMSRLHRYTVGQDVTFFDDDFAGRIAQKQAQAANSTTSLSVEFIHTVLFAGASLIGSVILIASLDPRSAVLLAAWVAAYVVMIRFFMPRIRVRSKARAAARAMVTGQVVDTITNIRTVKLFAHSDLEDRVALEAMDTFRERGIDFGWVSATFRFCLMALAGVLPLVLVGMTLVFWNQGTATAGDIAVAGSISIRLAQMTGWVSFTLLSMYSDVGELEDAIRTLSPAHRLPDSPNAEALRLTDGRIDLTDVRFLYGGKTGGLDGVTLTVNPGERLGIVGASGAGKSTLVSLLLRLYDPEEGRIEVDGQDIRGLQQESLRRHIGMVTQETAMFNRSAFENIAYGNPSATEAEVYEAARKAEAHDFIGDLEDFNGRKGYDAHLGERGVKLSGGQRQRIAIARAILKDAPILVLDEATSALDSEVEASIQSALDTAMQGKTVIAIAHRLSTLSQMDRIIVLDAGKIVEQGSHLELLEANGLYARYWNRQSGGFINVKDAAE